MMENISFQSGFNKMVSNYIKQVLRHSLGDRAVLYAILARVAGMGLGPLVVLFVGAYLRPEEQGVYYVFGSLLQLRVLVDLGFSQSAQQLLAHAFGSLNFHRTTGVSGDPDQSARFLSTARFVCRTFIKFGLATLPLVGLSGYFYLHSTLQGHNVTWVGPWWLMALALGGGVASLGLLSVADGANQVALTNKWRFAADLLSIVVFIGVLWFGGGLWASAAYSWAKTVFLFVPVIYGMGKPLISQIYHASSDAIDYRKEVAPLQLRNMIVWGMGFFCFYSYNPMALSFCGPVVAGIVGMSLQISNMLQGLSVIWFNTKIPLMGNLAGAESVDELDALHWKGTWVTLASWFLFAVAALVCAAVAKQWFPDFGHRYGSIGELSIFVLGTVGYIWAFLRGAYIRAHRVEPFSALSFVQALFTVAGLALLLPQYKAGGAAVVFCIANLSGAMWVEFTYQKYRRMWHSLKIA